MITSDTTDARKKARLNRTDDNIPSNDKLKGKKATMPLRKQLIPVKTAILV